MLKTQIYWAVGFVSSSGLLCRISSSELLRRVSSYGVLPRVSSSGLLRRVSSSGFLCRVNSSGLPVFKFFWTVSLCHFGLAVGVAIFLRRQFAYSSVLLLCVSSFDLSRCISFSLLSACQLLWYVKLCDYSALFCCQFFWVVTLSQCFWYITPYRLIQIYTEQLPREV
jgi:hypothetical protein